MPLQTSFSGDPSRVFGDRYPYPIDGKHLMWEFCTGFSQEFNQRAKRYLIDQYGDGRLTSFPELAVASAYPTTRQQCPRLAVQLQGSQPQVAGIGSEVDVSRGMDGQYRVFRGQQVTDTVEVAVCAMNSQMRDDLSLWFRQYMIDAIYWAVPQLGNVFDVRLMNSQDDMAEYTGGQGQPGFQFYTSRHTFRCSYDLIVASNVDELQSIVNWQLVAEDWAIANEVTLYPNVDPNP